MTDDNPWGRFSLTYVDQGPPKAEFDKRFRFRLNKLLDKFRDDGYSNELYNMAKFIESELGIGIIESGFDRMYADWDSHFTNAGVKDLLDTVVLIRKFLERKISDRSALFFSKEARRIFKEENVSFEVDEKGEVHPMIDSAFASVRHSAIAALSDPRYSGSLECIEKSENCLLQESQDFKGAIVAVFEAAENLFKLMYEVPRLSKAKVKEKIGPFQESMYKEDKVACRAANKALSGFGEWVDAAHNYRHAPGKEKPSPPPKEVAILLISQGYSYVRWLAEVDRIERTKAQAQE